MHTCVGTTYMLLIHISKCMYLKVNAKCHCFVDANAKCQC
jgi:hypothetical protein